MFHILPSFVPACTSTVTHMLFVIFLLTHKFSLQLVITTFLHRRSRFMFVLHVLILWKKSTMRNLMSHYIVLCASSITLVSIECNFSFSFFKKHHQVITLCWIFDLKYISNRFIISCFAQTASSCILVEPIIEFLVQHVLKI